MKTIPTFTELKAAVAEITKIACTGEIPRPLINSLRKIDESVSAIQDSAEDGSFWMDCYNLREEIEELLNSEAALFA